MLQLRNQTPFEASLFLLPDEQGVDTLYVVVKATFDVYPQMKLADMQIPIAMKDEFLGDPTSTSLKAASEVHLNKPGTDVVVLGDAIAPEGRPVRSLEVFLAVGERRKTYVVSGERKWKGWFFKRPSRPALFTRMPMTYEHAFGGTNPPTKKGQPDLCVENPVGRGFRGKLKKKLYKAMPLPCIESKKPRLKRMRHAKKIKMVGLGFIAPAWQPRLGYAGTYDEAWQKSRAPFLPKDFDPRYFQVAHPDWVFDPPLSGGEVIETMHLSERIHQRFYLPQCQFDLQARLDGRPVPLAPRLETVLLMPNEDRLALTWRASLPCDKRALKIEEVSLDLVQMQLGPKGWL